MKKLLYAIAAILAFASFAPNVYAFTLPTEQVAPFVYTITDEDAGDCLDEVETSIKITSTAFDLGDCSAQVNWETNTATFDDTKLLECNFLTSVPPVQPFTVTKTELFCTVYDPDDTLYPFTYETDYTIPYSAPGPETDPIDRSTGIVAGLFQSIWDNRDTLLGIFGILLAVSIVFVLFSKLEKRLKY